MNRKLLVVLRGLNAGHHTIFQGPAGDYASKQCDIPEFRHLVEGYEEKGIETRLQFELYGEYPLSHSNSVDYEKNIKPIFKK